MLKLFVLRAVNLSRALGDKFILCNADSDIDKKLILKLKKYITVEKIYK